MAEYKFDVQVSAGLTDATSIHRIVDFFSIAHLLTSNSLYIPLAERLIDPNEGIDSALDAYAISAGPCAGMLSGLVRNNEEFKEHHVRTRRRTYVSCWSQLRESVAMWALYSPDSSSVQITTTIGQLKDALHSYFRREHDPRNAISDTKRDGQFIRSARIAPVRYLSILELARRINRRRLAYDKLESKGLIRAPANALERRSTRDHARADQYRFAAFEMKDTSFSHEREVRAVIQAVPYDLGTLETARTEIERLDISMVGLNLDWVLVELAQVLLEEEAIKKQLCVAETLFLPVPTGFITQVSIDPRCSLYKQKHMRSFFEERGIPIASSTCFGYAANAFDVKPRSNVQRNATDFIQ